MKPQTHVNFMSQGDGRIFTEFLLCVALQLLWVSVLISIRRTCSKFQNKQSLFYCTDRDKSIRHIGWLPMASGKVYIQKLLSIIIISYYKELLHIQRMIKIYNLPVLISDWLLVVVPLHVSSIFVTCIIPKNFVTH